MTRLRIYLDTSVISFLDAEDVPDFQRITQDFFARHARKYELFVSDVVVLEISQDPNLSRRQALLDVVREHPITILPTDRRNEVEALARLYLSRGAMPPAKLNDALHVAFATVHEMDILLSWNFKHLANVHKEARISALNVEARYHRGLRLTSPLEVEDEAE